MSPKMALTLCRLQIQCDHYSTFKHGSKRDNSHRIHLGGRFRILSQKNIWLRGEKQLQSTVLHDLEWGYLFTHPNAPY